jgi:hypothetical protein
MLVPPLEPMTEPFAIDGELALRRLRDDPDDFAHIVRWRAMPHVHQWWDPDDPAPDMEEVLRHYRPTSNPEYPTTGCLIELEGRPVGYLQFYPWSAWVSDPPIDDGVEIPLEDDPWGLDIYIGEPGPGRSPPGLAGGGAGLPPPQRGPRRADRDAHDRHGQCPSPGCLSARGLQDDPPCPGFRYPRWRAHLGVAHAVGCADDGAGLIRFAMTGRAGPADAGPCCSSDARGRRRRN